MKKTPTHLTLTLTFVILFTAATTRAADDVPQLRQQVAVMRQQLAQSRLELQKILAQVRELKDYLAAGDPAADIRRWHEQQQQFAAQRQKLALELQQLQAARQSMRDARQR